MILNALLAGIDGLLLPLRGIAMTVQVRFIVAGSQELLRFDRNDGAGKSVLFSELHSIYFSPRSLQGSAGWRRRSNLPILCVNN
jgi:hypothetical protein